MLYNKKVYAKLASFLLFSCVIAITYGKGMDSTCMFVSVCYEIARGMIMFRRMTRKKWNGNQVLYLHSRVDIWIWGIFFHAVECPWKSIISGRMNSEEIAKDCCINMVYLLLAHNIPQSFHRSFSLGELGTLVEGRMFGNNEEHFSFGKTSFVTLLFPGWN